MQGKCRRIWRCRDMYMNFQICNQRPLINVILTRYDQDPPPAMPYQDFEFSVLIVGVAFEILKASFK